ncbi:uncharacterized protein BKA78DRAFT_340731 [Phyllosticta capitalensis]|uniref:uncharacterized protein n=1 Tax=Phyllosticta capitalensis TaxID=121624 RepID=UPI00312FA213
MPFSSGCGAAASRALNPQQIVHGFLDLTDAQNLDSRCTSFPIQLYHWLSFVHFLMAQYNTFIRPRATTHILLAFLSSYVCRVASENSNYFSFPLLAASIPTVHNGDTVNVTWKSHSTQASLNHWCNQVLQRAHIVEEIDGLAGDGHHVFVVNTSWTSPCHFQYVNSGDTSDYIDSGALDVTNEKATPAVTWLPSAVGTVCGVQTVTSTLSAGQKVPATTTVFSTITGAATLAPKSEISGAKGIGIGIAVGAAGVGLLTSGMWMLMRRRQIRQNQQPCQLVDPRPEDTKNPLYQFELSDGAAPLELDPARKPAELSSTPKFGRQSRAAPGNFF